MKAALLLLGIVSSIAVMAFAAPGSDALYKAHDWFALRDRIAAGTVTDPLALGATAIAFGEEEKARSHLDPLLGGKHAADAHGWLSYIAIRKGHYKTAALHIEAADPGANNPLAATFRDLPDQTTIATSPATIGYRIFERKLFVPLSVNGHPSEFILDSDANLSFVSETAAKQLGLIVRHSSATTTGALGAASKLSVTTADVTIGNTRLRDVAFMVLPDSASLFATLAPQQQGALGLPVLLAMERVSWNRDGQFRIGAGYDSSRPASTLAFDGADPIVRFSHSRVEFTGVFDTGAEMTDLWPPFAAHFPKMLEGKGTAGMKHVRGFGGDGQIPELVLPYLDLDLGGQTVKAKPAHVLTGETTPNSAWLAGRLGIDLLRQARIVTIDFRANRLQLTD